MVRAMNARRILILAGHAFVGWALCAATMGVGLSVATLQSTLVAHAILAPVFFGVVTWMYVRRFNLTSPLQTATFFLLFVGLVDFFLVALWINKSLQMFASVLGTWIPFMLIFTSTYLTSTFARRRFLQE